MNVKYIIISPVKDEADTIERTIQSVIFQTVRPLEWIIVSDGSKDKTEEIIRGYIVTYPWIKLISLPDRGYRLPGKGVIDAFYEGFNCISKKDWDFVVKLDGDLSFEKDYFENIFSEFGRNAKLGIASGKTYLPAKGDISNLKLEWCPDNCTRGPSKIYRKDCFEKIGGIKRERGWDTFDDIAAMVEGYEVRSFAKYKLVHYRPIGTRTGTDKGIKSRILMGRNFYYMGYHPLYMILKCLKMMITDKPMICAGTAALLSYLSAAMKKSPQIDDKRLVKQLRKVQLKRILGTK